MSSHISMKIISVCALLLLPKSGFGAQSQSQSQSTITKTNTAAQTGIWFTTDGVVYSAYPYSQYFTEYFESIAVPMSGSIGMGRIKGQIGYSRSYPLHLMEAPNISVGESNTSLLRQELNTNSLGEIITPTWASTVAQAGGTTYTGTKYAQNSIDLTILSSSASPATLAPST